MIYRFNYISIYRCISICRKSIDRYIDISINLCQDFKKCQYFDKFMSIFQKNVNISLNVCPKRSRSGAKRSGSPGPFNGARDPPQARASQDPGYI